MILLRTHQNFLAFPQRVNVAVILVMQFMLLPGNVPVCSANISAYFFSQKPLRAGGTH